MRDINCFLVLPQFILKYKHWTPNFASAWTRQYYKKMQETFFGYYESGFKFTVQKQI